MKKQSGFTLIELMVVMAIIAILATAGLAAYTGYIKKARDATRIADISAINTILLSTLSSTSGSSLDTVQEVADAIKVANNNTDVRDPKNGDSLCYPASGSTLVACGYRYTQCDAGLGFAVSTGFESKSNQQNYALDPIGAVPADPDTNTVASASDGYYSVGSCKAYCDTSTSCGTTSVSVHTLIPAGA